MRLSLRYRLLVPLALLLVGIAGASVWTAYTAATDAERRTAAQLSSIAHTLTVPPTFPLTSPVMSHMKGFTGAEFLLVRKNGTRVGTFAEPLPELPLEIPVTTLPANADEHTLGPPVSVGGEEYRCLRLVLRPPQPPQQEGSTLYIFYPEPLRRAAVWNAARPPLILGGVGGLIAIALMAALGDSLVRRIRSLEQRTRLIAAGEFQPMPLPKSNDELRDLYREVNVMTRKLADLQDVVRRTERLRLVGQFSGGLAHQLRNAAGGAKLAIEVFLTENPDSDAEPLQVALRQLDRIEFNLRQFLEVGRPTVDVKQPCDLNAIIDQTVSLQRPRCQYTGTALEWKPSASPMPMTGDANQLTHLFTNVIGNAVEAAGPGGSVDVTARNHEAGFYVIEIADTGPGPPASIAERLFEPFVTGKEQGIGLGLSVAKQAVDAHGGRLSWQRRGDKTVFVLELPKG